MLAVFRTSQVFSPHLKCAFARQKIPCGSLHKGPRTHKLLSNVNLVTKPQYINIPQTVQFSTSSRRNVPPIFWVFAKPLGKIASVITGRTLRMLFKRLPKEQRQKLSQKLRSLMPAVVIGVVGFSLVNYVTHLEDTPITGRRRYMTFNDEQMMKIAEFEKDVQLMALNDELVKDGNDPRYRQVEQVVRRLVAANQDIPYLQHGRLTLLLVDKKERNAFVLPTGHVFVYTGLLNMVQNDDQLAVVMGHELAHAILKHGAERVSAAGFVDNIIILVLGALWFFIPTDGIAIITHWFFNKVTDLLLNLPYERKLENEADEVGLQLMAKACYDVRESSNFWDLMKYLGEVEGEVVEVPELFSTHPSNQSRIDTLTEMIPKAIGIREQCKCPRLSSHDPRLILQHMKSVIEDTPQVNDDLGKAV